MRVNDYQQMALRTAPNLMPTDLLENAAMGLNGESGELIDHIKKWRFQGHELDREYIAKELGDAAWYIALGAKALGLDLSTVLQMNVDKLQARYPDGFSEERSRNR